MRTRTPLRNITRVVLLSIILLIVFFPLYWMLIGTFKVRGEFFTDPPIFWPRRFTLDAYRDALLGAGGAGLIDSLVVATSSMVLSVALGALAAYAIAQYKWGGKNFIFLLLVVQMMPPVSIALPLFLMFHKLKLLDTYFGLIVSDTVFNLPYAIWLLQGFFEDVPSEIGESAKVDGANRWQIFTRITLPLVKPGIMATAFFTFIFAWNEFMLAFTFSRTKVTPLTVTIPTMVSADTILWEQVYAISLLAIVPVIILALFLQRYLVRGLTFGSVKA